jgi:hypothetical protein
MFINANLRLPILKYNAIVFYECNDKNFKKDVIVQNPYWYFKGFIGNYCHFATSPLCHFATLPLCQSSSTMAIGFHRSQTSPAYKN